MSSSILFPTNQYTSSCKSSQQIQKLMVPDEISSSQIFSYLLNKNHPLQMLFVYKNFYKNCTGIISTICQKAVSQQPQNQILICESLKVILQKQKVLPLDELDQIFRMTLQCLNNLNSVANQPLAEILQLLLKVHPNKQSLLAKLQCQILQLGKSNQPTISKVTSGRLISIISKHLNKFMIKGQMIDILKKILTDNQIQARKVWVSQIFPKLLQRLQLDFVELHLQQKIYECVYDENQQIGVMALKVIFRNITRFSIQEQSSRIVKLFIDSLTSKNDKVQIMVTQLMGEVFQKLINIIMKNQVNCTRFWRSLVELAQGKNQKVLNNLVFNLPGILLLSSKFHKTDPFVDIYCELFYEPLADKVTLISYYHQIVYLYPHKKQQLKQVIYWIFGQLFDEQEEEYDIEAVKIINSFLKNIYKSKSVFFIDNTKEFKQNSNIQDIIQLNSKFPNPSNSQKSLSTNNSKIYDVDLLYPNSQMILLAQNNLFETQFCEYIFKYIQLIQYHKNSQWLILLFNAIKQVSEYLPIQFIERSLLPKIYNSIKTKSGPLQLMIQLTVILLRRDIYNLMNFYASKIHVELSKSTKSHQRQAALQFLYYCSYYFSIQIFQQYKLGQKFLNFSSDKSLANKFMFMKYLQRIQYFLTRQQKIQMAIILSRLMKDSDEEIVQMLGQNNYSQRQQVRQLIQQQSRCLKQKQRQQVNQSNQPATKSLKPLINNRRESRQSKQLKKQDLLKKRIQTTKSKTKILIKQVVVKKKTLGGNNFNLLSNNSSVTAGSNGSSILFMNSTIGRNFTYKKNS